MSDKKSLGRIVWVIKFGMIAFGYLALSMFQHTFNPLEFHWIATILFFVWSMIWLKAKVNTIKNA